MHFGSCGKGVFGLIWRHYRKSFFRGQWRIASDVQVLRWESAWQSLTFRAMISAGLTQYSGLEKANRLELKEKQMPCLEFLEGMSKTLESLEISLFGWDQ